MDVPIKGETSRNSLVGIGSQRHVEGLDELIIEINCMIQRKEASKTEVLQTNLELLQIDFQSHASDNLSYLCVSHTVTNAGDNIEKNSDGHFVSTGVYIRWCVRCVVKLYILYKMSW